MTFDIPKISPLKGKAVLESDFIPLSELRLHQNYDFQPAEHEMRDFFTKCYQELDNRVIAELEKAGYKFETKAELEEFAKARCEIHTSRKLNRKEFSLSYSLFVDGKQLAEL